MSIQSKHILNTPETLVIDSLQGLCALNPQIVLDKQNKIVYVKDRDRKKVALMCGGGSGHEPAHAAYVGRGMLTGAVCGNIFASPNPSQVRRGLDFIDNDQGIVIIVKNYTGDVLNFGLAKEQFSALHPDKADRIKFIVVGDDVAVGRTQGKIVGRRGLAGTILVYKIAGALADQGGTLDEVHNIAELVANNIVTIGVSLGHAHVPGTTSLNKDLPFDEIEIGMGIHNESGHRRVSPPPSLRELIPQLLDNLTSPTDPERSFVRFKKNDNVVVLINNLGGTSELELGGIVSETRKALEDKGFQISRVLCGTFMTSLNMPGFSLTLLLLPYNKMLASSLLSLLDNQPHVPAWKWTSRQSPYPLSSQTIIHCTKRQQPVALKSNKVFLSSIKNAANELIANEAEITRMDAIAGDGDCGLTLKMGAEAVLNSIESGEINADNVIQSMVAISSIAEEAMGGTSGALYSIFLSAVAQGLQANSNGPTVVSPNIWANALESALTKLYTYTRARPPSRTLIDPLAAFISNFSKDPSSGFQQAIQAAIFAAETTKDLDATAGRSAYIESNRLCQEQIPDPGAWGVKVILESFIHQLDS